ncbi:MAG: SDR family NAD(P)-dependent oxidoreductase [Solirubrobacteraceae bacterium]
MGEWSLHDDKVIFITGAARGIGAATAIELARHGARPVLADVDDSQSVDGGSAPRSSGRRTGDGGRVPRRDPGAGRGGASVSERVAEQLVRASAG